MGYNFVSYEETRSYMRIPTVWDTAETLNE